MPAVSICMPSWNQAPFLTRTLDSALSQTFRDFEIIFVDDGSTDATLEIAHAYEERHPSIFRALIHEGHSHKGISASTNLALKRAASEFIVILDSDDLWYPNTLARRVAFLGNHPDTALACSHYDMIDENDHYIRRKAAPDISEICRSRIELTHSMIMGCVIGNPTVIVRQASLRQLEPFTRICCTATGKSGRDSRRVFRSDLCPRSPPCTAGTRAMSPAATRWRRNCDGGSR